MEHIIPESLWNTKQILPPGIVCDKCNNYFSRKVEKPFLSSHEMEVMRFNQSIPNKKGRIPKVNAVLHGSDDPVEVLKDLKSLYPISVRMNEEQFRLIEKGKANRLYLPKSYENPTIVGTSRFLAKVALEALAQRLLKGGGQAGVDYIVEEIQFDEIRNHARYGHIKNWPYFSRRIYDEDFGYGNLEGQIVHEYDFLVTKNSEYFFVLALYGLEMTINLGGPEISGYEIWLRENDYKSPLYSGKNANS